MTLLIVDDHAPFREIAGLLLACDGVDVVGEAGDGASALAAAARLRPDVVLLDVQLPDRDGISVAEELASWPHPPQVVLTSSRDAASYGQRLARASVTGFIAKADVSREALDSVLGQ